MKYYISIGRYVEASSRKEALQQYFRVVGFIEATARHNNYILDTLPEIELRRIQPTILNPMLAGVADEV